MEAVALYLLKRVPVRLSQRSLQRLLVMGARACQLLRWLASHTADGRSSILSLVVAGKMYSFGFSTSFWGLFAGGRFTRSHALSISKLTSTSLMLNRFSSNLLRPEHNCLTHPPQRHPRRSPSRQYDTPSGTLASNRPPPRSGFLRRLDEQETSPWSDATDLLPRAKASPFLRWGNGRHGIL